MSSDSEFKQHVETAIVAFEKWCEEEDSNELDAFLTSSELSESVAKEVRKYFEQENKIGRKIGKNNPMTADFNPPQKPKQKRDWPDQSLPTTASRSPTTTRFRQIGPYKLVQQIGEGGMGTVWMAEQEKPVRRKVALKLIRADVASRDAIARFEAERQALAMMDHQNIAKVLDAGTTDSGGPYFVMELVKGIPLTKYCDQNKLSIPERLELFIPVCKAVHHAHQKGIIHRDLKPSNVLVALYDGKPFAKVIDFGLAKALEHTTQLTDKTMFTEFGKFVGTLQYVSPEQAELNALDVDIRTDIYSLGVMLYELLTGTTPIEKVRVQEEAFVQIMTMIKEQEPPIPSIRINSTKESAQTISDLRQIEPRKLEQILKGDLDWIVMQALAKDRNRRYESASEFASDINRFLESEPVVARPPSIRYRVKKFVAKYRMEVAAAGVLTLSLVLGLMGTTLGVINSRIAEHKAKTRLKHIENQNEIMTNIFTDLDIRSVESGVDPLEAVLAKRLVNAAALLAEETEGDPEIVGNMQGRLGLSILNIGFPAEATPVYQQSLLNLKKSLAENHPDVLTAKASLAHAYSKTNQIEKALQMFEETLRQRQEVLGESHPDTLNNLNQIAAIYMSVDNLDKSIPSFEKLVRLSQEELGKDHIDTLTYINNLATAYKSTSNPNRAVQLFEDVLERSTKALGVDHPDTLHTMSNLAQSYQVAGNLSRAIELFEEGLSLSKAKLGNDHPDTLTMMNNLAMAWASKREMQKAMDQIKESLELCKNRLGKYHVLTIRTSNNLAYLYQAKGDLDRSIEISEEAVKLAESVLGDDHPVTQRCLNNLATAFYRKGQLDRSTPIFERMLAISEGRLGRDHPETQRIVANLATNYRDTGRLDEAISLFEESTRASKKYPSLGWVPTQLRLAYFRAKQIAEHGKLADEQIELARTKFGGQSHQLAGLLALVATESLTLLANEKAEIFARECLQIREEVSPDAWNTFNAKSLLGAAYLQQGNYEESRPLLVEGYKGMNERLSAIPRAGKKRLIETVERLANLAELTEKETDLEQWRSELVRLQSLISESESSD